MTNAEMQKKENFSFKGNKNEIFNSLMSEGTYRERLKMSRDVSSRNLMYF